MCVRVCEAVMAAQLALEATATRIATSAVVTALEQRDQGRLPAAAGPASKRQRPAVADIASQSAAVEAWRAQTLERLARPLNTELILARAGPGGQKIHYMPSDAVIGLANEVFGFDGWRCEVLSLETDFVRQLLRASGYRFFPCRDLHCIPGSLGDSCMRVLSATVFYRCDKSGKTSRPAQLRICVSQ